MNAEQTRKEDLRKAVRSYLCDRLGTALTASSIKQGVSREWDSSLTEVMAALSYLVATNPQHVESMYDGDGSTLYYRITADGVLAHERNS